MPPSKITSDVPVPLMLEQLRATSAWRLMEERLEFLIERRTEMLVNMPGDASLAQIQRVLGQIEAFRLILKQPKLLQQEWDKARRTQQTEGNP